MSPSMMPTLPPHCDSASARLTATVVLPTPPLPAPTAMMFLTPGTAARPAAGSTASRTRAHLHVDRGHAGNLHHGGPRLVAHLVLDRTRRRRQLDGERDAAALDLQIFDEAESDDVAIQIGVPDDLEGLQHARLIKWHTAQNIVQGLRAYGL